MKKYVIGGLAAVGVCLLVGNHLYEKLRTKHNALVDQHNRLVEKYNALVDDHNILLSQALMATTDETEEEMDDE